MDELKEYCYKKNMYSWHAGYYTNYSLNERWEEYNRFEKDNGIQYDGMFIQTGINWYNGKNPQKESNYFNIILVAKLVDWWYRESHLSYDEIFPTDLDRKYYGIDTKYKIGKILYSQNKVTMNDMFLFERPVILTCKSRKAKNRYYSIIGFKLGKLNNFHFIDVLGPKETFFVEKFE